MTTADCLSNDPNCVPSNSTLPRNDYTHFDQEGMRPWLGQITYTMIAAQALIWTAFNLFKYR